MAGSHTLGRAAPEQFRTPHRIWRSHGCRAGTAGTASAWLTQASSAGKFGCATSHGDLNDSDLLSQRPWLFIDWLKYARGRLFANDSGAQRTDDGSAIASRKGADA